MEFQPFDIQGPVLVKPHRHGDDRGWFAEEFRVDQFTSQVADVVFVQHNRSYSRPKGTLRGLHFQLDPRAQGKLVRCPRGRILDVAVDLRSSSPTYGQHIAVELTGENGHQLWVPAGFAHGFCTLEEHSEVAYLVTDYYSPEHDRGLLWSDPALGIDWPVTAADAILSSKDANQPTLAQLGLVFT